MKINSKILSKVFHAKEKEINNFCSILLRKKIRYKYLKGVERDQVFIKILERIRSDKQIIASKGRTKKWKDGWQEAFNIYKKSKSLVPKFYTARENKYFRLNGDLIRSNSSNFEVYMVNLFRHWYFKKYLKSPEPPKEQLQLF